MNSTISQIQLNNDIFNLCDAEWRNSLKQIQVFYEEKEMFTNHSETYSGDAATNYSNIFVPRDENSPRFSYIKSDNAIISLIQSCFKISSVSKTAYVACHWQGGLSDEADSNITGITVYAGTQTGYAAAVLPVHCWSNRNDSSWSTLGITFWPQTSDLTSVTIKFDYFLTKIISFIFPNTL